MDLSYLRVKAQVLAVIGKVAILKLPVSTPRPLHSCTLCPLDYSSSPASSSPSLLKHHIKDHLFPVHPFNAPKTPHPGHLLPSVHVPWALSPFTSSQWAFWLLWFPSSSASKNIKPSASSLQTGERRSLWRIPENTVGGSSPHTWHWLCLVPAPTHSHPQLLPMISQGQRRVYTVDLRNRVRRVSQVW